MKCIGFERLIDYLDGRLEGRDADEVERHLAGGCVKCISDRGWYEKFKSLGRRDQGLDAPPWVLRRAVRLFEAERAREKGIGKIARGVVQLIFDSFKQPAATGARQVGSAQTRQLVYAVDEYSIDLQMAPSGERAVDLIGQILNAAEPGFDSVAKVPVGLARRGRSVRSTVTDDIGMFVMKKLGRGEYDLQIETSDMTINVINLPVTAAF